MVFGVVLNPLSAVCSLWKQQRILRRTSWPVSVVKARDVLSLQTNTEFQFPLNAPFAREAGE